MVHKWYKYTINKRIIKQSNNKLDKKKNYHNNTVVGVDQIYLGKELIYEEDIYITKNKNIAKESILSKIKKWFHD